MRLKLDLDAETVRKLVAVAVRERRPIPMQAEVLIQRALASEEPETRTDVLRAAGVGVTPCEAKQ